LLLLQIISYLATPLFLVEYALSSFIPFLLLVAFGIHELGSLRTYAALAIAMVLVVGPIHRYILHRPFSEWKVATQSLAANLHPGEIAMVTPGWTIDVVRYYLRNDPGTRVVATPKTVAELGAHPPSLLLICDGGVAYDPVRTKLLSGRPELLKRATDISLYRLSPLN